MVYILWIVLAFICGYAGEKRECGAGWAFFWGLVCPLVGIIYVALSNKKKSVYEASNELEFLKSNGMINVETYNDIKSDLQRGVVKSIDSYKPMNKTEQIIRIVCISIIILALIVAVIYS